MKALVPCCEDGQVVSIYSDGKPCLEADDSAYVGMVFCPWCGRRFEFSYHGDAPPQVDKMAVLLAQATELVSGDRQKAYGPPEENHARTAALWSDYLGTKLTSHDVCMLNILQKVSRQRHHQSHDNLVDIAGYAANAERCSS